VASQNYLDRKITILLARYIAIQAEWQNRETKTNAKETIQGIRDFAGLAGGGHFLVSLCYDSVVATLSPVPEVGVTEALYVQTPSENTHHYPLASTHGLVPVRVLLSEGAAQGGEGVFVKSTEIAIPMLNDDRTFAVLEGSAFQNGSIEVELNGAVSPNVSRLTRLFARGFIGICFRISEDMSSAECLYLRPENGQAEDATRRTQ
jgi:hypothetical protein